MTPHARATLVVALFAGVPAVVAGVAGLLAAGPILGAVLLVAVAVALAGWVRVASDRRVLAAIGGRDADPVADARLWNLAEGLSIGAGVRQPRLRIIDSPACNAMAAGTRSSRAVVGVTAGLLAELDRIELEAVLAEELVQVRRQETVPATVLAATFGFGRVLAIPVDRDVEADAAAVALTRYPPALASALEKVEAKGSAVAGQPASLAYLWLADPNPETGARRGRLPILERVEALREL